jgi:surfeit locus 1 family protein
VPNPIASILRGRQFRPGLWPTAAAAAVIVTTVLLGNWQARRAEVRGAMQAQSAEGAQHSALRPSRATDITTQLRYRHAVLEGEYLAARQIWLDNRTHNGVAGFYVLTPLRLDDGSHVLVNRGWIAATLRHTAPAAPPPAGRVIVTGRLNQAPPSFLELQHVTPAGPIWQNLDLAEFARVSGLTLAPLLLEQEAEAPDGLSRDWPAPDSGREKNVSYMWQWYSFAGLTAVLWLVLNWQPRAGK